MDNPLVTIVTPSFNKGNFIEETILSVINQTYKNIEHIIIDGGSTDNTLTILEKYPHLVVISEPDTGQSNAVNKGWKIAKGSVLGWLNADDTYLPDTLKIIMNYFNEHPECRMVYGDALFTDAKGIPIKNHIAGEFNLDELLSCKDEIPQPSVFISKTVFDTLGGLDEYLRLAMDLEYWIRVGLKYQVIYIPELLSVVKFYPDAASTKYARSYLHEYEHILMKVFSNVEIPPAIKSLKIDSERKMYFRYGVDRILSGDILLGVACIARSFCCRFIAIG